MLTGTINIEDAIASIKTSEHTKFGVNIGIDGWSAFTDANAIPFDVVETPNYITFT